MRTIADISGGSTVNRRRLRDPGCSPTTAPRNDIEAAIESVPHKRLKAGPEQRGPRNGVIGVLFGDRPSLPFSERAAELLVRVRQQKFAYSPRSPAKVWAIEARVGDKLGEEDTIIVLESMKMEIPVVAPVGGTLKEILVAEGDAVAEGHDVAVMDS